MASGPWSGASAPTPKPDPQAALTSDLSLPTEWVGARGRLFGLAVRTGLFTILTLGFYRFWMKTRLRRWYWSSIRPGGVPLEYTGEPIEKLLGFLMAVVVMSFYIGIVNLILMFVSYSLLANNFAAYAASLVGVIPLWFYANYRARRYVMARTRWAGIRFGVDHGGWGYAGRALLHWAITIGSFGLLWPRMTFALEKYKVDRTWFGTARFEQGGRWQMLYRPFVGVILPGAIAAAVVGAALIGSDPTPLLLLFGLVPWLGVAVIHYSVSARRTMANHKTIHGVRLLSAARTGRILGIYSLGYFLTYLTILVPLAVLGVVFTVATGDVGTWSADFAQVHGPARIVLILISVVLYFTVFLSWSVLRHLFVTMPIWRHYAETLTLTGARALEGVGQRARDEMSEAEGFAEALDLGAAI